MPGYVCLLAGLLKMLLMNFYDTIGSWDKENRFHFGDDPVDPDPDVYPKTHRHGRLYHRAFIHCVRQCTTDSFQASRTLYISL